MACAPALGRAQEPSAPPAISDEDAAFFEARIRPLLATHCYECHAAQADVVQGGLRLDHAGLALTGGESGPAIVPGHPQESRLIEAVRYENPELQMPPAGKLGENELANLVLWIERGAPFPPSADDAAAAGSPRVIDMADGRRFWSFQPLAQSNPPAVSRPEWVRRPIDAFILQRLDANGLAPSAPGLRRELVRRAWFDLVGLPPPPEDVASFVADEAPDAWPRMLESLLASPHYGERWGRYWLDLVRYCDIPEQWAESGQAWLYRDWVVRALNEDLPYDQFVTRQLAADLLPGATPADSAALGMLGLSPTYWKELKLAPGVIQSVVAEEWEERINTVGSTLLGLTVACARCHDHKFDPITTEDYYGLAGVFASVRQVARPLVPADRAAAILEARGKLTALSAERDKLLAQQPVPDDARQKADELAAEIDALKATTPDIESPLAYTVEEASLKVLPDGPDRTRLDWQAGSAQDVPIQIRGNPLKTGRLVPRRFLAVLSSGDPPAFARGSGRLDLAEAVFRDAGPLAARVIVNRVWRHHFGRGLVETPSNFGQQGDRPSHPELLDDLASRFVQAGWSLKWLHREIMLSAAYQQSSAADAARQALDPDNRWLWRMNRRRLEVEPWRDAILAATGELDRTVGGPPADLADPGHIRRTLYGTVKRRELDDLLRLYDVPDATGHSPARVPTITPLQQLFVLNSPFVGRRAEALARRVRQDRPGDPAAALARAYDLLYGRPPSEPEAALGLAFLTAGGQDAGEGSWSALMEVLLAGNELMFID
jgi:hypothetical protein